MKNDGHIGTVVKTLLREGIAYVESKPDYLARKYYRDAEWYRKHGQGKVYRLLRRMCLDAFEAIDNQKNKDAVREYIKGYLPKNQQPQP